MPGVFLFVLSLPVFGIICHFYSATCPYKQLSNILVGEVSFRQYIVESCFIIHTAAICLLIGIFRPFMVILGFPVALVVKNLSANTGDLRDTGSIPGSGISPAGGHGNPLQYSCPENPTGRGELQSRGSQRVGHD